MFNLTRHRLFKMATSLLLVTTLLLVSTVPPALALVADDAQATDIETIIADVPTGDRWLEHLKNDLLPFWDMEEAFGNPIGNYPTYRCNDGSLYSQDPLPWEPTNTCQELEEPVNGIVKPEREYVRAKSRQIFAYGVAFHLTGEAKYLALAKAGVDYLLQTALDWDGGAYTYFEGGDDRYPGEGKPSKERRISQDMAYAVAGLGFYYYLTHDNKVLYQIISLKNYIFDTYYDKEWDLLAWAHEDYLDYTNPDGTEEWVYRNQRELVAQLDQVYGYMLLLAPILPKPEQSQSRYNSVQGKDESAQWQDDLVHLATIMSEQFYTPDKNLFFGAITEPSKKQLETDHTDFGHSIKTLWLIYEIGKLTGHYELTAFAQEKAPLILEEAYLQDGTWGRRRNKDGSIDHNKEWWILAELDQTAATFSLRDPSYAKYLPSTYDYWFNYMVDQEHGGIWHWVNAADNLPDIHFPKQHSWKNAFHSFEHALVGYITGQAIHNLPVKLYYAFSPSPDNVQIRPYFFGAKVESTEEFYEFYNEWEQSAEELGLYYGFGGGAPGTKTAVTFTDVR